uniref:Uncharacterized protein n=1 Tax=Naja naja TaxID=35670 RepID=A0A8C6Y2K8_NAJNA
LAAIHVRVCLGSVETPAVPYKEGKRPDATLQKQMHQASGGGAGNLARRRLKFLPRISGKRAKRLDIALRGWGKSPFSCFHVTQYLFILFI